MKQMSVSSEQLNLLPESRLMPGVRLENGSLVIPPEGGGLFLPDLSGTDSRWLNVTLTVEEDHAQAFEFRFYAEKEAPRVVIRFGLIDLRIFCGDIGRLSGAARGQDAADHGCAQAAG